VELEARSLVAIDRRADGVVTRRLEAVADGNGDVSKGSRVVMELVDGRIRDRAATWLANQAEIPLLTRTEIAPES
jgi:hypothetical protein